MLKLYETAILMDKNIFVDDIETYLASTPNSFTDNDNQYIKIAQELDYKVILDQDYQLTIKEYNYCKVTQDSKIYYFFVTNPVWKSSKVLQIHLILDTVNTYRLGSAFTLDEKTKVIREHKARCLDTDRAVYNDQWNMHYIVDQVDEGINGAVKHVVSDNKVVATQTHANQNWYLAYITNITNVDSKPIDVYLYPKNSNTPYASGGTGPETWDINYLIRGVYYFFLVDDNPNLAQSMALHLNVGGTMIERSDVIITGDGEINLIDTYETASVTFNNDTYYHTINSIIDLRFADVLMSEVYFINASSPTPKNLASIDTLDRSLSSIVKIIELPYLPTPISWNGSNIVLAGTGFELIGNRLHLIDLTQEFENNLPYKNIDEFTSVAINDHPDVESYGNVDRFLDDPKIYHSAFYDFKVSYDSFASSVALERVRRVSYLTPQLNIKFKHSNNLTSEMLYKLTLSNANRLKISDYDEYLISNRNNELGLFHSAYLEYLRNGYNYDLKQKNKSIASSWVSTGLSLAGAIAGFAASGATGGISTVAAVGLATNAVGQIGNSIKNTIDQEQSIAQKLREYEAQAAAIANATAIDLLNEYNGNKLHILKYAVSDNLKELINDLFYYCGYADNTQHVPNVNTRYWFNYLQAEIELNENTKIAQNYIDDLKRRYATGVTFFHTHEGNYDFEQEKENWETFLFS